MLVRRSDAAVSLCCGLFLTLTAVSARAADDNPGRLVLTPPVLAPAAKEPSDEETFKELDINQDGVLTGTERRGLEEFDTNKDGVVTLDEYRQGMNQRRAVAGDEREFGWRGGADGVLTGPRLHGVESYDTEKKGSITKEQFVAYRKAVRRRAQLLKQTPADEARLLFWQLDGNRDGRLSGTEMKDYLRYDVNHAERLYEDEFVAAYVKEHGGEKPTADSTKPTDGNDAEWPEVRDQAEHVVFCMPGRAERTVGDEQTMYKCGATPGGVDFDFQLRFQELPQKEKDYEPMAPVIFNNVIDNLAKQLGAKPRNNLKGLDARGCENAPFDGHAGLIYRAELVNNQFLSVRFVLRKNHYLQAFVVSQGGKNDAQGRLHDRLATKFFESLKPIGPAAPGLTGETSDALDGEWIEQSEIQNGTLRAENEEKVSLVIKGTRLVAVHGKSRDEMTFTVDVSKSPKQIDIQVTPADKPLLGIYEVQGDTLRLCVPDLQGTDVARPTAFSSPVDSRLCLTTLRRKKPNEPSPADASPPKPETSVHPVKPVETQSAAPAAPSAPAAPTP